LVRLEAVLWGDKQEEVISKSGSRRLGRQIGGHRKVWRSSSRETNGRRSLVSLEFVLWEDKQEEVIIKSGGCPLARQTGGHW